MRSRRTRRSRRPRTEQTVSFSNAPHPAHLRILIVKLSSLGDVVHAMPVVHDIGVAVPGATIDWVVEPAFGFVVEFPVIDGLRHPNPASNVDVHIGWVIEHWRFGPEGGFQIIRQVQFVGIGAHDGWLERWSVLPCRLAFRRLCR